jgi:hypothetical protein
MESSKRKLRDFSIVFCLLITGCATDGRGEKK